MTKLHWTSTERHGLLTAALIAALLLSLLLAPEAFALKASHRQQVKQKINKVKSWEMTKELGLDDEQARIFFPAMESYENDRDMLSEERGDIEATLDSLLADGGPRADAEILKNLERLRIIERQQTAHEEEYQRKLGRILSPQQRARYELFERDFEVRLRQMIREIQDEESGQSRSSKSESGKLKKAPERKEQDNEKREVKKKSSDRKTKTEDKKKDKSEGDNDTRNSKSHTGDKDKDESGKKKSSDERSSRGKRSSRDSEQRTEGPLAPRRGV
ncbi:hypothetical protein H8E52_07835 [bacterium]|nr:hypothetical protein [bacterium]